MLYKHVSNYEFAHVFIMTALLWSYFYFLKDMLAFEALKMAGVSTLMWTIGVLVVRLIVGSYGKDMRKNF